MTRQDILRALQARTITPEQAKARLEALARGSEAPQPQAPPARQADAARERIAIVGMSGRYPGADSLEAFWDLLAEGRSAVRAIPPSRWDVERFYDPRPQQPGKVYCRWLGMLDDVESFDPLFFGISPAEATVMDPQHRLFLQESWHAFEDAGYAPSALDGARCGVYLGIMNNEYVNLCQQAGAGLGETTGNSGSIAAARIAYQLNLKGPAIAIDTACSSSLVATHLACQALLAGEIDLAVAGGVTLYLTPESYISMCGSGMLSATGRCSAFDNGADGFVPGEGVGVLVLKRLGDAIADGDRIHAVVLGSGINQDGRTNGITAPSLRSQIDLLRDVHARHAIDPASIGYVEAHGTGTKLGDPIEFEALVTAFRAATADVHFCALGSVKSNIGHTSAAAGIASVHKAVLSLREKRLVPTLHYTQPNEHCAFEGSPFVVNTALRDWATSPGRARRAAVSSFGYSGTNAHLVLEEWDEPAAPPAADDAPQLFVVSARSDDALRAQCAALARFLARTTSVPLADVAHTLQIGRAAFDHRLAFVAAARHDAIARLEDAAAGRRAEGVVSGRLTALMRETALDASPLPMPPFVTAAFLAELAAQWVRGVEPVWHDLPRSGRVRLAHLPTYPFARERCWVDAPADAGRASPSTATALEDAPASLDHLELLVPDAEAATLPQQAIAADARVAIVGGTDAQVAAFLRVWPHAIALPAPTPDRLDAWTAALRAAGRIDRVLWFAPDAGDAALDTLLAYEHGRLPVLAGFHAIKALLAQGSGDARLQWTLVTREARNDPAQAALQGLIASAVKEHPDWTAALVDLGRDDALPVECIAALPGDAQGRVWFHRDGTWTRECLRSVDVRLQADSAFRRDGVYVIIGGAGGVGEVFTEHLLRRYRARVVWIGRRRADAAIAAKLARLTAFGPTPLYLQADATDPAALAAARATALRTFGAVHGVVHSAIELHDRSLASLDAAHFEQAFAIKARIAANVFRTFADDALDCVLLFSSLASYSREAGQSNYSAGSLYQDALARQMALRFGRPVKTLNWGFWGAIGATAGMSPLVRERFAQAGVGALEPGEAMAAVEILMQSGVPQMAALHRLAPAPSAAVASTSDAAADSANPDAIVPTSTTHDTVAAIDIDARALEAHVKDTLLTQLATTLKLSPERIDPDGAFADYGVDSISSVRIVRALNEALGIELAGTSLFDHSSVNKLVRHILQDGDASRLQAAVAATRAPVPPPADVAAAAAERPRSAKPTAPGPIAVVGMSGRFPKSDDLDALWAHLAAGHEVTEPISRWPVDTSSLPENVRVCPRGGFLSDIDLFDPLFFNISGTEATYMDPQHRLLLETCWHALEDAGYAGEGIAGAPCGVYVGFNGGDYGELLQLQPSLPPHAMWGNAASVLSSRIAYHLDLQGPAITLDTACSSSLVAVHLACQGLWTGETDIALAGGVWIQCTPGFLMSSSRAGMLSPTGQCRAFGAGADGFVPSEGVGVVVLKRLQDALDAGDHIHGVIKGSAINQDGASNGITAPSAAAQERLERHVYTMFGIDPADLQLVEAHGTGTILGDPIEASALTRAFRHYTDRKGFCALGSIKTNLGHTGAAAGVAGLIKVLLALRHKQIPPSLHFDAPNPHIAFADSPFVVNTTLRDWPAPIGRRRLAAVSSFGLSGTNAHMVVEEAPAHAVAAATSRPTLLVVSGYREDDLPAQVDALAAHLEREGATLDLDAIGFTLAVGRRHHRHRLALVATSAADASAELRRWRAGTSSRVVAGTVVGNDARAALTAQAQRIAATLAQTADDGGRARALAEIASLHVQGAALDAEALFGTRRRVPLPLYRFSRKRYWVPEPERARPADTASAPVAMPSVTAAAPAPAFAVATVVASSAPLHPFVHAAVGDASATGVRRFATHWTGQEFFLRDHVVQGAPMLPGAGCLEMVRAAASLAYPDQRVRQLRNVVWLRPLAVATPVDLEIVLEPAPSGDIAFRVLGAGSGTPHCQGRIAMVPASQPTTPPAIDIGFVRTQCDARVLTTQDYYAVFDQMGLLYGEGYRGIQRAFVGEDQILAQLRLPDVIAAVESEDLEDSAFQLHPSLLDSALQVAIGFEIGVVQPGDGQGEQRSLMLFALDGMELFGRCTSQMWVWIRRDRRQASHKLDVDLCTASGRVVASLKGVTSREAGESARPAQAPQAVKPHVAPPPATAAVPVARTPAPVEAASDAAASDDVRVGALTLAPAWEPAVPPEGERWPDAKAAVVVIGDDEAQFAQLKRLYPRARRVSATLADTVDRAVDELRGLGAIDHLVWLLPDAGFRSIDSDRLVIDQQRGVMAVFRLVKALLRLEYAKKPLGLTFVTSGAQPVFDDEAVDPTHAGVHGLVGTLAKEYPGWRVRLVDVQPGTRWPWPEMLALPADPDGNAWAHRFGRWHRQRWVPCRMPEPEQSGFRHGGVYVIIGGAGGIGEAFSEYLIRRHAAQVVWIGLRRRDEVIEDKIDRLAKLGPAPYYIAADATDALALERASADVERRFGTIHGIVHAALLMAGDPLERMDEQRFWRGLAAKIEVSVRMAQAFAHLPLDFVLFFSSIQALEKTPRQANYAAGCTVEDAFAARLGHDWKCPVRVVNWGYWGSVGFAAISSGYRNWIAQAGMGSVEPAEGMAALERLLAGPFRQLAFLKTKRADALRGVQFSDDRVSRIGNAAPVVLLEAAVDTEIDSLIRQGLPEAFETLILSLLRHTLDTLGVFTDAGGAGRIVPQYRSWLRHTLDLLAERGLVVEAEDGWRIAGPSADVSPWDEWDRAAPAWRANPETAAPVALAEATLRELEAVLEGRRQATDVLFPKASPHLVEGIYRDSPVPDFFNRVLSTVLVRHIERRRRIDPDVRLRILEIGAGTGGTTTPLVKALAPYADAIAEYRFTDLSKAFAVAAEREFAERAPYMQYGSFDVERSPAAQGIGLGEYDIVVAANVLHATRDIRRTLRNAKATLKRNGILLVNEVCATSLFAHVTFGLLKGWWLYEDAHLRIPGSPALSPASWRRVLAEEGFEAIGLPAENAALLGQQIVVARSDGWIRQPVLAASSAPVITTAATAPSPVAATQSAMPTPALAPAPAATVDRPGAAIRRIVRETLATTLDIDPGAIRDDAPLTDYGLDSMLAVQAVEVLNTTAGTALTTTSLFDHPTIDALVAHLLSTSGIAVEPAPVAAASPPAASPAPAGAPAIAPAPQAVASAGTDVARAMARGIAQALVDIAGIDAGDIRGDVPFTDYGVDSMLAVQIVEVLNQRLSVELTTTSLFDHPTIDALVAHLAGSAGGTGWIGTSADIATAIASAPPAVAVAPAPPVAHAQPASTGGVLRRQVLQSLAEVLEIEVAEIDAQTPFTDYGLDSMLAVQWVERLNQSLQLELTTTSPFDHPTLDALMAHILAGRDDEAAPMDAGLPEPPAVAQPKRRPQPMSYTI